MEPDRGAFADFLRSRREKLTPEEAGLPAGRRRRTPGLRREEVAERAGIGVDWYVRLEQGRSVNPSRSTVDSLARALRLDKVEHAHLRALAFARERPAFSREVVPETLQRIVGEMNLPAYVTGRRWDILCWNAAADDIFAFGGLAEADRNILVSMMTKSASRRLFGEAWETEARRMVGQFRASHDLWGDDPAFVALIERLRSQSAEFATWWRAHDVGRASAGLKTLSHPGKGRLKLEYATFQSNDDAGLKLAIYVRA